MDHIVGDDIAIGIRQVVRQLLNLASDPDSQSLMARQPEFVSGLVSYMSESDKEVRLMAARAIEFLSTHPNNKEIVASNQELVQKMMNFADDESEHARAISRRTLYNIKGYLTDDQQVFVNSHPVAATEETKQIIYVIKTYAYTVDSLNNSEICNALQSSIIQIPGVVSITMEKSKKKIIVTVRQTEDESKEEEIGGVVDRVIATHSSNITTKLEGSGYLDDEEEIEIDKANALAMYGFTSIESRLEKKKLEKEAKQKKEKKISWLFGKVSSAMSSWW